jgi:hypothetical protein
MHWTNIYAGICVHSDLIEIYVDHSNYKNLKTDRTIVSSHFSVLQYDTILKSLTNEIFCVLNKMREPVHLFEPCWSNERWYKKTTPKTNLAKSLSPSNKRVH